MISMIAAMDNNRVIGMNGTIPWKLPNDVLWFKDITMSYTVIMGRKTFESIGGTLKGRENIVLSRNSSFSAAGCQVMHSVEEILIKCRRQTEAFVAGGEQIYKQFMPFAVKIYITEIDAQFYGDTFFPLFSDKEWKQVQRAKGVKDKDNPYDYWHVIYERRLEYCSEDL